MDEEPDADDGEDHQSQREFEDRGGILEQAPVWDAPSIKEQERWDEQQKEDVGVKWDAEVCHRGEQGSKRDLHEGERDCKGQHRRDRLAEHDSDQHHQHDRDLEHKRSPAVHGSGTQASPRPSTGSTLSSAPSTTASPQRTYAFANGQPVNAKLKQCGSRSSPCCFETSSPTEAVIRGVCWETRFS